MKENPVAIIEIEDWGAVSILRRVNDGVYICTCSVRSDEYKCKIKHVFFYDSHFKPLHQQIFCWYIIDNISDAPIYVLEDIYIQTNINLKHSLKLSLANGAL